ncbi:MAG: prolyl oligopeptidase family serine peptidase [Myxococcales bacterium]|nr:prolyl oligopeptidase family serine peptidase [Myxococcales bacterium]
MHAPALLASRPPTRLLPALLLGLAGCGGATPSPQAPEAEPVAEPVSAVEAELEPASAFLAEPRPVANSYHGVEVLDPYQWLEDPESPEVRAWSDAQNAQARRILGDLPNLASIRERVSAILSAPTRRHYALAVRAERIFAMELRPPREQPLVVVLSSVDRPDEARVLLDPSTLDEAGGVAVDWFVPSADGRLIAISLSRGGSERGDVHVYDVESGERVHEIIEHVNGGTAGGDLAWAPDGSGFFYTRYPHEGEREAGDLDFYQQLYFHRLGTDPSEDRYEIGRDFPRIAEIQIQMDPGSGRLLLMVQKGDGGEFQVHLRERDGRWRQLSDFDDAIVQASFGPANDLYVVSRHEAPRGKVLRIPIRRLDLARAQIVVPESEASIVTEFWGLPMLVATPSRLVVAYQLGGPSELRVFDLRGRQQGVPTLPPVSAVRQIVPLGGERLLIRSESFVAPPAWLTLEATRLEITPTALRQSSPVDSSGWEVRREFATSRDGTRVPLNIVMPRGMTLDGSAPCVVTGYGGYGVNIEPRFRPLNEIYLSNGVVFVVANLRGGAEFGEAWHSGGSLVNKQNVFDDFAAGLGYLVEHGYTSRERLGIIGGSNGGLLMGATMTQHPELVRAVVSFVGIYDMLRVELSPNGAFNVTEFGTVENEAHFRALHAYSPYHHVTEGTAYPATLFLTGANDPRVEPWHSRKMTARLQAAQAGEAPILLRTSDTSGHGMGTALSEEIEEYADVFAFLFAQLQISPTS